MSIFRSIFGSLMTPQTPAQLARERLPQAQISLLDAHGTAEHAQAVITQKTAEIARLSTLVAADDAQKAQSKEEADLARLPSK